ncbi:uncharacterized protein LOC121267140 [Juglans microcarpa x Juglans regia]|uniref:uncharacterized protein LOC121267140 n=1 Tax=Juglans microcarpa x Juglans regia TaxID=2249226 RepID=UPI001B7F6372|nr:uncharacterized protein LOC121267140 [Juglans microcarpa x Juglans regia]
MEKKMDTPSTVDQLLVSSDLPYNAEVMAVPLPPKFKVPQMEAHDGSKDPLEHLETFKTHMTLHGFPGEVVYRAFPLALKGVARTWFGSLSSGSIGSFEEHACLFMVQFLASRKRRHQATYLLTVKQQDDEGLKSYLSRFNRECMTIDNQDEKITLVALLGGIWPLNPFMSVIARKTPTTLREFMDRADGFINAEDTFEALTAQRKSEVERAGLKPSRQRPNRDRRGERRGASNVKKKREAPARPQEGGHTHTNLAV